MTRAAIAVALAIILTGCASTSAPLDTPSPSPSPSPSASASAPTEIPAARWTAILDDLAGRGVATEDVRVIRAEAVTWNDGSLGCPEPGRFYTQALVDGLQVVVSVAGTEYDYRFGRSDTPRLCENEE